MNTNPMKNGILSEIKEPFSENDVMYLQAMFLTPGVHHINIDSISKIRAVIQKILESLQYHQKSACLTLSSLLLAPDVCDIVKVLITDDYLVSADSLTQFFLDQFYFDFLWIEETPQLLDSIWYEQFKQHLIDFNFNRSVPIVIVCLAE